MSPAATDDTVRRIALAWRELRRGAAATKLRRQLLGPVGPTSEQAQLDALEILASAPDGLRMGSFADALRVDASTATRSLTRLEGHGLAERRDADDDQRIVIATATPAGRRLVERVGRVKSVGMERLLEPFDGDERRQFAEYLERFVASIDSLSTELDASGTDRL